MKTENKDGIISVNGKKISEIPQGISMLSVFDANPFLVDSKYDDDGWIYSKGDRLRKWYTKAYSDGGSCVMVWGPVLRNPPAIEARYHAIKQKADNFFWKVWRPTYDKVIEVGKAHAKPTHAGSNGEWWMYTANKWVNHEPTLGFDWLDKAPDNLINHDIGQSHYDSDRKMHRYYKYVHLFRLALYRSIKLMLDRQPPKKENVTLKLTMNGRSFWYTSVEYSDKYFEWKKLVWPEDELIEVNR
jgi:hypothetical protein